MPIGVNLTSNPVTDCCLTISPRSPLTPLKKGGTRFRSKSTPTPLLKGDLGGSRLRLKATFIMGFRRLLTPMGSWSVPTINRGMVRSSRALVIILG
ncbi:MAG TPA: hypothetical protein DCS91_13765 [Microcoleaceae bacterium UBA11344]|nr:hypothetical protein [Microcoleaceae cyanobacterium UBA11344]